MSNIKFSTYLNQDKCWELIENGKSLDLLYPDRMNSKNIDNMYEKYIESVLEKNEVYVLLTGNMEDYALTSNGRVINCKTRKQIQSIFPESKTGDVRMDVRGKKILMSPIFQEQNWVFNARKILSQYEK